MFIVVAEIWEKIVQEIECDLGKVESDPVLRIKYFEFVDYMFSPERPKLRQWLRKYALYRIVE